MISVGPCYDQVLLPTSLTSMGDPNDKEYNEIVDSPDVINSPKTETRPRMSSKLVGIAGGAAFLIVLAAVIPIALLIKPGKAASMVPRIISTPQGSFKGSIRTTYDGQTVVRYAGIPFAKPPVGDLRFRPPEPIETNKSSNEIFDATNIKKSCWSITKKFTNPYYDEDCLYLNVYVPDRREAFVNGQGFSVMVWIHGGGFVAGGPFPEPAKFVARGDVIVVTVNYRLGVFGFLTTSDDVLPANNGLWDQILALRWVKDNIHHFGGDANSITLGGESAGAMSASILTLSPMSSDLFNRVLIQSGTASSLLRKDPAKMARDFGEKAGCGERNINDFGQCLRNLSVETILKYSKSVDIPDAGKQADFYWLPTIDNAILPDYPRNLLNSDTYLSVVNAFDKDYLFGLNNNDGSLVWQNFMNPLPDDTPIDMNFFQEYTAHLLTLTQDVPESDLKNVTDLVTSFYSDPQRPDRVRSESLMDLSADAMFYSPGLAMALAVSNCYEDMSLRVCESNISHAYDNLNCAGVSGRSFMYMFDFCPPRDGCKLPCMTHGLQVLYQFPKRAFKNDVDQELSDRFIDYLSDFIKTGQPGSNTTSTEWPAFERNLQSYLSFSPFPIVKQYLQSYRMKLWLSDIPKLLDNPFGSTFQAN